MNTQNVLDRLEGKYGKKFQKVNTFPDFVPHWRFFCEDTDLTYKVSANVIQDMRKSGASSEDIENFLFDEICFAMNK